MFLQPSWELRFVTAILIKGISFVVQEALSYGVCYVIKKSGGQETPGVLPGVAGIVSIGVSHGIEAAFERLGGVIGGAGFAKFYGVGIGGLAGIAACLIEH